MTEIVIAGAGGYGIEAYDLISYINKKNRSFAGTDKYHIVGFIDDYKSSLIDIGIPVPIIGRILDWQPEGDERYVLGIAMPESKEKVATLLKGRGAKFETLIAPTAIIDEGVNYGEGCTFKDYSIVSRGAMIGAFVSVSGAVGGKSELGDYCTLGAFSNVADAVIGKRVFVGSQAIIINGKRVGNDVTIGAGSVVIKNVKSGVTVFGNPAKVV